MRPNSAFLTLFAISRHLAAATCPNCGKSALSTVRNVALPLHQTPCLDTYLIKQINFYELKGSAVCVVCLKGGLAVNKTTKKIKINRMAGDVSAAPPSALEVVSFIGKTVGAGAALTAAVYLLRKVCLIMAWKSGGASHAELVNNLRSESACFPKKKRRRWQRRFCRCVACKWFSLDV